MTHGTRTHYQAGCRCTPCRASEARYRTNLRTRKAKGFPLLGALISPVEARRRIRQLRREGYTNARIAEMAGWKNRHVQFTPHQWIRLATLLRVRRVARFAMLEGVEVPVEVSLPAPDDRRGAPRLFHQDCGGLLVATTTAGHYTCDECGDAIALGVSAYTRGYIRRQGFNTGTGRK